MLRVDVVVCTTTTWTSLCLLAVLCLHPVTGDTMSSCTGGPNKTLDIQCGPGHMLHILRSFYGYSPSGRCRLTAAEEAVAGGRGCVEDDKVQYPCVGRQRCIINLPSGGQGKTLKSCDKPSNYFQVEYKCVPEKSVYDICRERVLMDESGYIRTSNYPSNYHQQGQCNITVKADPSQEIRLQIIDLQLQEHGHTACYDHIYFRDTMRSITLCGRRSNTSYIMKHDLHIEVASTSRGMSKGFWLYYEAYPPLANSLQPPTHNTHNNKNINKDLIFDTKSSSSTNNNNINDNNNNNNKVNAQDATTRSNLPPNRNPEHKSISTEQETHSASSDKGNNRENNDATTPVFVNNGNTVPLIRNKSHHSSNSLPFAAIAGGVIGTLSLILIILLLLLLVKWLRERHYFKAEKILEIRNPAFRSSGDFYEQQQQPNNSNCYC